MRLRIDIHDSRDRFCGITICPPSSPSSRSIPIPNVNEATSHGSVHGADCSRLVLGRGAWRTVALQDSAAAAQAALDGTRLRNSVMTIEFKDAHMGGMGLGGSHTGMNRPMGGLGEQLTLQQMMQQQQAVMNMKVIPSNTHTPKLSARVGSESVTYHAKSNESPNRFASLDLEPCVDKCASWKSSVRCYLSFL